MPPSVEVSGNLLLFTDLKNWLEIMLPLKQAPNTTIFIKASKTVARNIYRTYEIHNQCPQLMRQIQCPQFTKMGKIRWQKCTKKYY